MSNKEELHIVNDPNVLNHERERCNILLFLKYKLFKSVREVNLSFTGNYSVGFGGVILSIIQLFSFLGNMIMWYNSELSPNNQNDENNSLNDINNSNTFAINVGSIFQFLKFIYSFNDKWFPFYLAFSLAIFYAYGLTIFFIFTLFFEMQAIYKLFGILGYFHRFLGYFMVQNILMKAIFCNDPSLQSYSTTHITMMIFGIIGVLINFGICFITNNYYFTTKRADSLANFDTRESSLLLKQQALLPLFSNLTAINDSYQKIIVATIVLLSSSMRLYWLSRYHIYSDLLMIKAKAFGCIIEFTMTTLIYSSINQTNTKIYSFNSIIIALIEIILANWIFANWIRKSWDKALICNIKDLKNDLDALKQFYAYQGLTIYGVGKAKKLGPKTTRRIMMNGIMSNHYIHCDNDECICNYKIYLKRKNKPEEEKFEKIQIHFSTDFECIGNFSRYLLENYIQRFPNSMKLRMHGIQYFLGSLTLFHRGFMMIQDTLKNDQLPFHLELRIEELKNLYHLKVHRETQIVANKGLDIMNMIIFSELENTFLALLEKQTQRMMKFWSEFLKGEIMVKKLYGLGLEIFADNINIEKSWNHISHIIKKRCEYPYLIYGLYMSICNNSYSIAQDLINDYKKIVAQIIETRKETHLTDHNLFSGDNMYFVCSAEITNIGNILLCSSNVSTTTGYQKFEYLGKSIDLVLPPIYRINHRQYMLDYIETGKQSVFHATRKIFYYNKDHSVTPCYLHMKPHHNQNHGMVFVGVIKPIKSPLDYILTDQNGYIDTVTPKIKQDLRLKQLNNNRENSNNNDISNKINIKEFYEKFEGINQAFTAVTRGYFKSQSISLSPRKGEYSKNIMTQEYNDATEIVNILNDGITVHFQLPKILRKKVGTSHSISEFEEESERSYVVKISDHFIRGLEIVRVIELAKIITFDKIPSPRGGIPFRRVSVMNPKYPTLDEILPNCLMEKKNNLGIQGMLFNKKALENGNFDRITKKKSVTMCNFKHPYNTQGNDDQSSDSFDEMDINEKNIGSSNNLTVPSKAEVKIPTFSVVQDAKERNHIGIHYTLGKNGNQHKDNKLTPPFDYFANYDKINKNDHNSYMHDAIIEKNYMEIMHPSSPKAGYNNTNNNNTSNYDSTDMMMFQTNNKTFTMNNNTHINHHLNTDDQSHYTTNLINTKYTAIDKIQTSMNTETNNDNNNGGINNKTNNPILKKKTIGFNNLLNQLVDISSNKRFVIPDSSNMLEKIDLKYKSSSIEVPKKVRKNREIKKRAITALVNNFNYKSKNEYVVKIIDAGNNNDKTNNANLNSSNNKTPAVVKKEDHNNDETNNANDTKYENDNNNRLQLNNDKQESVGSTSDFNKRHAQRLIEKSIISPYFSIYVQYIRYFFIVFLIMNTCLGIINYILQNFYINQMQIGINSMYYSNNQIDDIIEINRNTRIISLMQNNYINDNRHIKDGINSYLSYSTNSLDNVTKNLKNITNYLREYIYNNVGSPYRDDIVNNIITLYWNSNNSFITQDYYAIFDAIQILITEITNIAPEYKQNEILLENNDDPHISFILNNTINQYYYGLLNNPVLFKDFISSSLYAYSIIQYTISCLGGFILLSSFVFYLYNHHNLIKEKLTVLSLLTTIGNNNIKFIMVRLDLFRKFIKVQSRTKIEIEELFNNLYEADVKFNDIDNNKKSKIATVNPKGLFSRFWFSVAKMTALTFFVVWFYIINSILFSTFDNACQAITDQNMQTYSTLYNQGLSISLIYQLLQNNNSDIINAQNLDTVLTNNLLKNALLTSYLKNFHENNAANNDILAILNGDLCSSSKNNAFQNNCKSYGGGVAQRGLIALTSYTERVLSELSESYLGSNRSLEVIKALLYNPDLIDLEFIYSIYIRQGYLNILDILTKEFLDQENIMKLLGIIIFILFIIGLAILMLVLLKPIERELANENGSLKKFLRLVPTNLIILNKKISRYLIKTSPGYFQLNNVI